MRISVNASKNYEVVVEKSFSRLGEEVKKVFYGGKIAVVDDENTSALFFAEVAARLKAYSVFEFTVAAGEKSKTPENYFRILGALARAGFTRGDCVLALGGGVVGDLAGFVASTYMRGINYIQVPTTLLAAVDSSVGGKTAVDLPEGKNLVGTFYQPSLVYVNVACEDTLPETEKTNGLGEIVKYVFLSSEITKEKIFGDREELVAACIGIKAEFVAADEFDNGRRALLNLGHTVGHAIENLSGYTLPHGLCVAKGINAIIDVSADFYGISDEKRKRMKDLIASFGFDLSIGFSKEDITKKILLDKKSDGKNVNFILIKDAGDCRVEKLSVKEWEKLFYGRDR
ncbi:MAG: 3-dehydroquinate synthase [Clostridia bacterium]|nr:3-dehydroquinate synthase [Clostridia bacterium]